MEVTLLTRENNEHDITWGLPDKRAKANKLRSSSTVTSIIADRANANENVNFELFIIDLEFCSKIVP